MSKMYEKENATVLSVHHINYNKYDQTEDNLISLCKSCHTKTNFSREDWTIYFYEEVLPNVPKESISY